MTELEKIISKLPISEHSKSLIPDYINFIQAPVGLKALAGVSEVYLELVKFGGFQDFPYAEASKFSSLAKEIVDSDQKIQTTLPELATNRQKKVTTALRGVYTDYPAYALFYYKNNINPGAFLRLQQAMLAGINLPQGIYHFKKTDFAMYGLAVRELTDTKEGREWLKNVDQDELDSFKKIQIAIEELINDLESLEDSEDSKKLFRLIRQLRASHLFFDVATNKSVIRRTVSQIGSQGAFVKLRNSLGIRGVSDIGKDQYCEIKVLGDLDDMSEHPAVYSVNKMLDKGEALDELEKLGVEHQEIEQQYEFIFVKYQDIPAYAQIFNDALRARGAAKKMELQNQFLPLSTQMLNDQDLILFSKMLKELCEHKKNKEVSLLLRCLFATSSNINRALNLQVVKDREHFRSSEEALGYDLTSKEWLIPVFSLKLKTDINESSRSQSRQCYEKYFNLPDMFKFCDRLVDVFGKNIPEFPFQNVSGYKKNIRTLLLETGSRLTLARLERYMTLLIAGKYEATQATYLFSNYLSTSSARRFYTSLSVAYYRRLYKSVCQDVVNIVNETVKLPDVAEIKNEKYIGARYCPEIEHVAGVLKELQTQLKKIKKRVGDGQNAWIEYHNLYTVFSIYAQGFLTGIRSVTNPFVNLSAILEEDQCIVFRDKDSEDQFHTRIAPLHPWTKKIADNYHKHRNAVLVRLAALNPAAVLELTNDNRMKNDFVFFLNDAGNWHQVRPGELKERLAGLTELPINSNRKLIRNFLLENNVPVHAIDTLLGHASRGEPFWGTCATHSFKDLSNEINKGLTKLINSIELKVLEGLSV